MTLNNIKNYKLAIFSALVLSLIIPFAGLNNGIHALQTTDDQFYIGKVADGTYNEDLAFQKQTQLVNLYDEKKQQKAELEQSLVTKQKIYDEYIKDFKFIEAFLLWLENETIKEQIVTAQEKIDEIAREYNEIQEENVKLYYIEPSTYTKYASAVDSFVNNVKSQIWSGKSFEESKKAFPLVEIGINHKTKSVEIKLSKDIENSPEKSQHLAKIEKLMPKDVPWFVTYGDYPTPDACTSRTSACDPMIGGIQMQVGGKGTCTIGIKAIRSGITGWVTAGHCGDGKPSGTNVFQPSSPGLITGTLQIEAYANNTPCDCAFIADEIANPPISNAIFQSSTSTYTPVTATSSGGQAGVQVKRSGVETGNQLGTVTNTNISFVDTNGVTITNAVKSTMDSKCGDSGGPVTNGLGSSFFGIHTHGTATCPNVGTDSYHAPYEQITGHISANPVLG